MLVSSLDYEETLQRVAHLAVPRIADWCTVHVIENGAPNRLAVAHAVPAMMEYALVYSSRYPEGLHVVRGMGTVLRTGEPEELAHVCEELLAAANRRPRSNW